MKLEKRGRRWAQAGPVPPWEGASEDSASEQSPSDRKPGFGKLGEEGAGRVQGWGRGWGGLGGKRGLHVQDWWKKLELIPSQREIGAGTGGLGRALAVRGAREGPWLFPIQRSRPVCSAQVRASPRTTACAPPLQPGTRWDPQTSLGTGCSALGAPASSEAGPVQGGPRRPRRLPPVPAVPRLWPWAATGRKSRPRCSAPGPC